MEQSDDHGNKVIFTEERMFFSTICMPNSYAFWIFASREFPQFLKFDLLVWSKWRHTTPNFHVQKSKDLWSEMRFTVIQTAAKVKIFWRVYI